MSELIVDSSKAITGTGEAVSDFSTSKGVIVAAKPAQADYLFLDIED